MIALRASRIVTLSAALLLAAPLLSGCGGSSGSHTTTGSTATTGDSSASNSSSGGSGAGGSGSGGSNFPGASGSVAAISGSSMEVQNQQSGQVTVSWSASTAFSKTVKLTAAEVTPGDCVTVTGSTSTGTLVASQVTVSKPSASGTCTTGRFGAGAGGGGFPGGNPSNGGTRPNNGSVPTPPSGSASGGRSGFSFASGKVTSVTASSLVIYGISSSGFTRSGSGSRTSTPPTSIKSSNVTVGVNASTTYSETASTAASSLAVGDCVTSVGTADSTGAVMARTVRIASTGGQSCSTGFGGFGGGGTSNG
jgi:hypothetical protein